MKPQYVRGDGSKATQMMWDACLGGGGPWIQCSCGIEHSLPCGDGDDYDSSEMFEYSEIDGQQFVFGCDGCAEKLGKYERFLWENRDSIRRYLKKRIDQEKAWADQEHLLNVLYGLGERS